MAYLRAGTLKANRRAKPIACPTLRLEANLFKFQSLRAFRPALQPIPYPKMPQSVLLM